MNFRHLGRMEEEFDFGTIGLSCESIIEESYGRFYMVHRPNRLNEINKVLYANHFSIRNLQFAYDHRDNQHEGKIGVD